MIMGIVLLVAAMCLVPIAYSIGEDVGYGKGYNEAMSEYDDAMAESREEHYLTD